MASEVFSIRLSSKQKKELKEVSLSLKQTPSLISRKAINLFLKDYKHSKVKL